MSCCRWLTSRAAMDDWRGGRSSNPVPSWNGEPTSWPAFRDEVKLWLDIFDDRCDMESVENILMEKEDALSGFMF